MLAAAAAQAPAGAPESGDGRFTFHRADDGYLRLDGTHRSGLDVQPPASRLAVPAVPDERTALEAEIARLQGDNAALKKELLSRNLPLPNGMRPEPPAPAKTAGPAPAASGRRRAQPDHGRSWRRSGAAWSR